MVAGGLNALEAKYWLTADREISNGISPLANKEFTVLEKKTPLDVIE
jgi:hypothetical protein